MASRVMAAGKRTLTRPGSHKACFLLGLVDCKCGDPARISISKGGDSPHLYVHLCFSCAGIVFVEEEPADLPRKPRRKRTTIKAW
jgi:hypothetical protein